MKGVVFLVGDDVKFSVPHRQDKGLLSLEELDESELVFVRSAIRNDPFVVSQKRDGKNLFMDRLMGAIDRRMRYLREDGKNSRQDVRKTSIDDDMFDFEEW